MLKLMNATTKKPVIISPRHIVSVLEDPQCPPLSCILTVTGVTYLVEETVEEIGANPIWSQPTTEAQW